jgi:hypothetical protein
MASIWVDLAISKREEAFPASSSSGMLFDEYFADELVDLGKYEAAEKIIQTLPSVAKLHPEDVFGFQAFRRDLLVKVNIGLHRYREAVLEANVPADCPTHGWSLATGEAQILIGNGNSAKQLFAADKAYPGLYKLYAELIDLTERDDVRAKEIARKIIAYWHKEQDYEIYELEFCEQAMLQKKCVNAARLLATEVERLKLL